MTIKVGNCLATPKEGWPLDVLYQQNHYHNSTKTESIRYVCRNVNNELSSQLSH